MILLIIFLKLEMSYVILFSMVLCKLCAIFWFSNELLGATWNLEWRDWYIMWLWHGCLLNLTRGVTHFTSGGGGVWESKIIDITTLETKVSSNINNFSGISTIFERCGVRRSIPLTKSATELFHCVSSLCEWWRDRASTTVIAILGDYLFHAILRLTIVTHYLLLTCTSGHCLVR